jgi:hypothetical protein
MRRVWGKQDELRTEQPKTALIVCRESVIRYQLRLGDIDGPGSDFVYSDYGNSSSEIERIPEKVHASTSLGKG